MNMPEAIKEREYRSLAELRYRLRQFLQEGDSTARRAGLEPQQYLLLLAIRGLPGELTATISTLAGRLSLRHHSTVELIDRMEAHGYVRRVRGKEDRRQVLISLQPKGEKLLEKVVSQRIVELRSHGRELVAAISSLLESRAGDRASATGKKRRKSAIRSK
jgi:DNA-binding MarR family transcriptional regulator